MIKIDVVVDFNHTWNHIWRLIQLSWNKRCTHYRSRSEDGILSRNTSEN